ncbi:MAG TPA: DUF1003 domain-containing protein [Lysobacter sp.]|nr:DUF1003 domain-containing protein [Lysobacter sp.]
MTRKVAQDHAAQRWFARSFAELGDIERKIIDYTILRRPVSENINRAFSSELTFGERLADRVAQLGGSWRFIIAFALVLLLWTGANSVILQRPFDPYPYIFLNLLLSMLAAIQAPVIMMSQNRQADKDRLGASHDYEVNLKAEIEISALHEKLDQLRSEQIERLLIQQQEQIELLTRLLARSRDPDSGR